MIKFYKANGWSIHINFWRKRHPGYNDLTLRWFSKDKTAMIRTPIGKTYYFGG